MKEFYAIALGLQASMFIFGVIIDSQFLTIWCAGFMVFETYMLTKLR